MKSQGWGGGPRLASLALAASLCVLGWSLERAFAVRSVVPAQSVAQVVDRSPRAAEPPVTIAPLAVAIDLDPFRPDRHRPAARFRLPGEDLPELSAAAPDPVAAVRLIGTAVLAGGSGFAMCQWGNQAPKLVRVGEKFGDLTLRRVEQGRAVFVSTNGESIEYRVPKSGS